MAYTMTADDLQGEYTTNNFPSAHGMKDEVWFQPDFGAKGIEGAIKAKIVGVSFTPSKVLYNLAVWDEQNNDYYEYLPLCNVDSIMVLPRNTNDEQ